MNNRMNLAILTAVVFLVSVCAAPICFAAEKFIFTPKLNGAWKTESNFFKAQSNERKVDTWLVQPGLEIGYETAKTRIVLDATYDIWRYRDNGDTPPGLTEMSEYDFEGYTGDFEIVSLPVERLKLLLNDQLIRTRDQGYSDRFSNATDLDEYFVNRFEVGGFYDITQRFTAGARYRNAMLDYKPEQREDSSMNGGILDLIFNLSETRLLDLNYQHWQVDYDKSSPDYVSNQGRLDYRHTGANLHYTLGVGAHYRDFNADWKEDLQMPIWLIDFGWHNPDDQGRDMSWVVFSWERNLNNLGYTTGDYKSHLAELEAGHVLKEKFPLEVKAKYLTADYRDFFGVTETGTTESRDDASYGMDFRAGYIITHWLALYAEGGFERRDSNIVGYDYENDWIGLRFESAFNFGVK